MSAPIPLPDRVRRDPPCRGLPGLPLSIYWRRQRPASFPTACHGELEFQYIRHGCGRYIIEGEACNFRNNTLIVIKPGEAHRLENANRMYLEKCCLLIPPKPFAAETAVLKPFVKLPRVTHLTRAESAQLEWILQGMDAECKAGRADLQPVIRTYLKLFCLMAARLAHQDRAGAGNAITAALAEQLLAFCENNYMRKVTHADFQRQFGYSAGYLAQILRRHTGHALKQHLMERRMAEARRLLKSSPNLKVTAIAEALGFKSFPLFNRMFKRIVGHTAIEYRGN